MADLLIRVTADHREALRKIVALERQLQGISDPEVEIDVETAQALRQVSNLESDIRGISDQEVDITVDTSEAKRNIGGLSDSLDDVLNQIPGVQGGLQGLLNPATLAGGAFVGLALGMNQVADNAIESAFQAQEVANKLQITTKRAQELRSIAAGLGIDFDKLVNIMYEVNNRTGELALESTGTAQALKFLNLTLDDLEGLRTDEKLRLIAKRTSELNDIGKQTFVTEELLGGSIEDLNPILSVNAEQWNTLNERVKEFNHLSDETVRALNDQRQEMALSNEETRLAAEQIGLHLVPAKTTLIKTIRDVITAESDFSTALGKNVTEMLGWEDAAAKVQKIMDGLIEGNLGLAESNLQSSMMVKGYAADLEQATGVMQANQKVIEENTKVIEANTEATQEQAIKTEFGIEKAREYRERQAELTEEFQMQFPELVKNTGATQENTGATEANTGATEANTEAVSESTDTLTANEQAIKNNSDAMQKQLEWLEKQRAKTLEAMQTNDIFRLSLGEVKEGFEEVSEAVEETGREIADSMEDGFDRSADAAEQGASRINSAIDSIPDNTTKTVTTVYNTVRRGQDPQSDSTAGDTADDSMLGGTTAAGQKYEGPNFSHWAQTIRGIKIPRYPFDSDDGQATPAAMAFVAQLTGESLLGTQGSIKDDRRKYSAALNQLKKEFQEYKKSWTPMAEGGVVRARPGGTRAILGEGGEDEAVIPLSKLRGGWFDRIRERNESFSRVNQRGRNRGGGTFEVTMDAESIPKTTSALSDLERSLENVNDLLDAADQKMRRLGRNGAQAYNLISSGLDENIFMMNEFNVATENFGLTFTDTNETVKMGLVELAEIGTENTNRVVGGMFMINLWTRIASDQVQTLIGSLNSIPRNVTSTITIITRRITETIKRGGGR